MSEPGELSQLATGWEPDMPVGDTLLRRFVFAVAESWEPAIVAMGGRVQRCAEFAVTDLRRVVRVGQRAGVLGEQPVAPLGGRLRRVVD